MSTRTFRWFRGFNERFYRRRYPAISFCDDFRQKMRAFVTQEYGTVTPGDVVIDVACGRKQQFLDYGADAFVVGADIDMAALRANTTCHSRVCCDFSALPFQAGVASRIVSVDTVEHVKEPEAGFCDLVEILKPHGKIIIATPNLWSPKGLFIRLVPTWVGNGLWRILRSRELPYPHFYRANTLRRLQGLLGVRARLSNFERLEEDPLWLVDLPAFVPALVYKQVIDRVRMLKILRSYLVVVFTSGP